MKLYIGSKSDTYIEDLPFELVERKGVGHPDTICDAIAERASQYYSQYFYETYGRVAHHWFDKVMLVGGESNISYGKGELIKPYKIIFAGKAARTFAGKDIPLFEILHRAAADVLSEVLTGFNPEKHMEIVDEIIDHQGAGRKNCRYRPITLENLVDLDDTNLVSNDCNLLSSHAPLSRLEQMVLFTERYINGAEFKKRNPDTGWDVKLLGSRHGENFKLIINMPSLGSCIESLDHYLERKNILSNEILNFIVETLNITPELIVNPQDKNGHLYLTSLGSAGDTGDFGVVGRGNRLNGLITPMRAMSIEAPAGKNPLDHTGKLYGVFSQRLAYELYEVVNKPVEVHIFTSKEAKLNNPDEVSVRIQDWDENEQSRNEVTKIIEGSLNNMKEITKDLIFKGITMW
ncbi:methionine adenosyltransferase [Clostridium botulinum]|uniref:methionine adenosyltransferase n=1 Tax=Clostridium botulinum TaxID=1491 RepID=UPI001FD6B497|nr:methionine adenosyltransferase [Clostridium botulinum]MCJ8174440.1 methionine adenosyltransferase [Clostridium botulinum]